ncbi:type IV pilus inner membrane component PilO [Azohydromonas caseinilytica]|uniref:Type 4a pilus biogenesis protein PilO n=1 Tax=Azohydromonas caseinilytica TaxID=2728836 RepID=A0A848F192_9BURK|nr:type 4a pilus biogenesis protein PilO [Azohydromonas caseinilytica]NML13454.1 type 4a pilus biogenesis protein PilO [Azohydromonas caseinilytica]
MTRQSLSGMPVALAWARAPFRGLDLREPGLWPPLPRWSLCALVALGVGWPAWLGLNASAEADLEAARGREPVLRQQILHKLAQAQALAPLQRRRQELETRVVALEEQLLLAGAPEELLPALHRAARQRGLQVELIRPEPAQARAQGLERSIGLRLSGRYHDLGAFAADVAALEPAVTLHELRLTGRAGGAALVLDATARTHRRAEPGAGAASSPPAPAASSGAHP